jgi:hypothetical protein
MEYINTHDLGMIIIGVLLFVFIPLVTWWIITEHEHEHEDKD